MSFKISAAAIIAATGLCTSALAQTAYPEVEPNESKAEANGTFTLVAGDTITGTATGTTTTSADYFRVKTAAAAPGIYMHRLALTTSGTAGHVGTVRGLNQSGGAIGTTDSTAQTSVTTSTPPRMVQWFGFGKEEELYYRVTGTSSTSDYTSTYSVEPVAPTEIGPFQAGEMTISTVVATGQVDTDLWVFDENFNAIPGFGNDDQFGTTSTGSHLVRNFPAGTYYLAVSRTNLATNQAAPADDDDRAGIVLDFPNAVLASSTTTTGNIGFTVTDGLGTQSFPATVAGQYTVTWHKLTVTGTSDTGGCCFADGTCTLVTSVDCALTGGVWAGAGTTCATANCPQPGACCLLDGTCTVVAEAQCIALGGLYSGNGTNCGAVTCPRALFTVEPNSGLSGDGAGIFFDLAPNADMLIDAFSYYQYDAAGAPITLDVYTKSGTYLGSQNDPSAWTHHATINLTSGGSSTVISNYAELPSPIIAPGGQVVGMYLVGTVGGMRYSTVDTTYSNADMTLSGGIGMGTPFTGTGNTPRLFSGTVYYNLADLSAIMGACCFADGTCQVLNVPGCTSQGGVFRGIDSTCATANCPQPGACCFDDGTCASLFENDCLAGGGLWAGANTACGTTVCAQPGACCFPADGGCALTQADACTAAGGIFQGAGTTCATGNCWTAPVLWNNGPLSTGPTVSISGNPAPAGTEWSEVQAGNGYAGWNINSPPYTLIEDFTIDGASAWQVDEVTVYTYLTGSTPAATPFTKAYVQIWDGAPNAVGSQVVFGDLVTNRLVDSTFANLYRIFNNASGNTRPLFANRLSIGTTLQPGTYWIEFGTEANNDPTVVHYGPNVIVKGTRGPVAANSLQGNAGAYAAPVEDNSMPVRRQEIPFVLRGQVLGGQPCYANCDESTQSPILNVADSTCFLRSFAAGCP